MPDTQHVYCESCGSIVQAEDRFCGVCGTRITSNPPEASTQEVPTQVQPPEDAAATQTPTTRSNRTILLSGVVGVLLLLLIGGGALAFVGLDSGAGLFGGSNPESLPPSDTREAVPRQPESRQEPTEEPDVSAVSPDAPPHPAFNLLLPTLKRWTDAPIMLPAELPTELENIAIDEHLDGDQYGILFKDTPPDNLVQSFAHYNTIATLMAVPESESEPEQYFEAELYT